MITTDGLPPPGTVNGVQKSPPDVCDSVSKVGAPDLSIVDTTFEPSTVDLLNLPSGVKICP